MKRRKFIQASAASALVMAVNPLQLLGQHPKDLRLFTYTPHEFMPYLFTDHKEFIYVMEYTEEKSKVDDMLTFRFDIVKIKRTVLGDTRRCKIFKDQTSIHLHNIVHKIQQQPRGIAINVEIINGYPIYEYKQVPII